MGIIYKHLLILFVIIAGSILMTAILFFWLEIKTPLNVNGETTIFKIESGESAGSIASHLESEGIIRSALYFRLYTLLSLSHQSLKRGEYSLSPKMSIRDIADEIFQGKVNEIKITIPEGLTLNETENLFIASGLMNKGDLFGYSLKSSSLQVLADKPLSADLEGYLFPDTYDFYKDSTVNDVVNKMVGTLDSKISAEMIAEAHAQAKTFYQILTMASLIEKETKNDPDRQIVSGILWKRLKAGVPLQVDATLIYITGRKEIHESDKKIKSPYNTYLYPGLPKGPIANPGLASIEAALFPKETPYWYYLNSADGKTVYSVTLEDHIRSKSIYLK